MHQKEPWRELCEQAAKEGNPERLLQLVEEIVRVTEPLRRKTPDNNSATQTDH